MRLTIVRTWWLAVLVAALGLTIGGGRSLAQEGTAPAGGDDMTAHHPAHIHQGTCAQPSPDPAYALTELAMDVAMNDGSATPMVEISTTTIDAKLTDLLAQPAVIDVHEVKELVEDTVVSCGEVDGQPTRDVVAVGIREVGGSEFSGIAVLQEVENQTTVTLYMAHGLSGAMQGEATPETSAAQISFHIPTITCGGCQARVEASLKKAPGIQAIAFDGQNVTVAYDPSQVTPEQLKAAIEDGGDTVEELGAPG